ncbi:hypothetical protein N7U66_09010 [Lacinutrix neustonica]|uniref:Uncharacterized protein n=1 Tax=Lacinutrix neustonica TaxID=2980107 RepID=A0A9E8SEI4_9FLAO|nr:hypothetical protein [Lacinutrix neustonica]WAC03588.1 hypothetical protein N7U66_09010 [Lacinutrix neustonica]
MDNPKILVLNLISSSNGVVASGYETKEITINGICVSDIAGMYSVTTTYGYHDFLPNYNPHTMDIEIVEVSSGVYSVFDMSGGLYSSALMPQHIILATQVSMSFLQKIAEKYHGPIKLIPGELSFPYLMASMPLMKILE